MRQAARKAHKLARCATDKKSFVEGKSKKEFFKIE
jgi:hypothetical protein